MKAGLRDFLLYVVIGVALVVGILFLALVSPNISHAWFSFFFFTTLLFVFLARMYWPVRRSVKVWLILALFMALHVGCYVVILHRVHDWPAFWYVLTAPIEVMLAAAIIYKCLKVRPPKMNV